MQHNEIEESSSRWFWRLGGGLLALAVVAAGGFLLQMKLAGGSTKTEPYEEYTVGTMTLRAMVTSSGVAVAQDEAVLSFSGAGQLSEVLVNLGDTVREGQPLMRLKSDDLENAAATAASSLTLAKLQLQKLQEGASAADLSDADRAVATAQAALTKAQNDLKDALDPATAAQITQAQGEVAKAQANLASAEANRETLRGGPTGATLADAEANLTVSQSQLNEAERALDDADSNENNMQSAYENAAKRYCEIADSGDVCEDPDYDDDVDNICDTIDYNTPLTDDQIDDISSCIQPPETTPSPTPTPVPSPTPTNTPDPNATRTPRPTREPTTDIEQATGDLAYASTDYRNAITAHENAIDSVTAATAVRDAAQSLVDELNGEDLDAANEAVISAQAALNAAQAALDDLLDGAKSTVTGSLSAAVDQAEAGLAAAQAERDKVISGATSTEIAIQQEEVHRAELELQQADIALNDATLMSPFDGTVSALPVKLGQVLNPAIPAITILTPGQLIFELNVGETELPSIKVGQVGGLLFDAIQGKPYTIQIFAIGLSPDTEQGVIIYKVKCKINGNLNDPSGPNPAPGMNGSASIVTEQRPNVIAIPSAAVHSRGNEQVVDLIKDDGTIESRPVVTGLSDGDNIEVTSGLEVGDKVALRTAAASSGAKQTPLPGGIQ